MLTVIYIYFYFAIIIVKIA